MVSLQIIEKFVYMKFNTQKSIYIDNDNTQYRFYSQPAAWLDDLVVDISQSKQYV